MTPFRQALLNADIRELLRGASLAAAHQLAGMAAGFATSVMLARFLGVSGLGVFTLAATIATISTVIGRAGLDLAMLRFSAASAHLGNWEVVAGIYRAGMSVAMAISGSVTLLLLLSAEYLAVAVFDEPSAAAPIRIMSLTIIPSTITILHGEMLKSLHHTGKAVMAQLSAPQLFAAAILGTTGLMAGGSLSATQAAWATLASGGAAVSLAVWIWRSYTPHLKGLRPDFGLRRLLQTSLPLFLVSSIGMIIAATDIVMLGIWGTADQVALYSVAVKLAGLVSFPLMAANSIASPKLSGLHAGGNRERMALVTKTTTLITGIGALVIATALWTRADIALSLFGMEFVAASTILFILTTGHFFHAATGPAGILLIAAGREILLRNIMAASAVANLVLNAILIPLYGPVGAAVASALTLSVMKVVAVAAAYRHLGILTCGYVSAAWWRARKVS